MQFSLNSLKECADITVDTQQLCAILVKIGFEVENISDYSSTVNEVIFKRAA